MQSRFQRFQLSTKEISNTEYPYNTSKPFTDYTNKIIGLSGATGFLGMHLLQELVNQPNIEHIYCYIRDKNKFYTQQEKLKLTIPTDKITFCDIDTHIPTSTITDFIHSAATLRSLCNYKNLYNDNVFLTKYFRNLCENNFHYISTLSVYASSNHQGIAPIKPITDPNHIMYGGYAQTKWTSEYLIQQQPNSKIYRLGLLTPSQHHPIFTNNKDFFYKIISLLKQTNLYPENYEEAYVDLTPVCQAAKQIVTALSKNDKIQHIANRNATSLSNIIKKMQLKPVSYLEWQKKISNLKPTEKMLLSITFFKTNTLKDNFRYFNLDIFQTTGHNWQGNVTLNLLDTYLDNIE